MMPFDYKTLVTKRSRADVVDLLQALKATSHGTATQEQENLVKDHFAKGSYNYTDLNRVTACMDDLNARFEAMGYHTGYQRITVPHRDVSILPEGYTQLEYIQSSGTQYIDTGFIPTNNTNLEVDFYPTVAQDAGGIAWCETTFGQNMYGIDMIGSLFGTQSNLDHKFPASARHIVKIEDGVFTDNGVRYWTPNMQTFTAGAALCIFAAGLPNGPTQYFIGRIFGLRLWQDDTIIRDFVPCTHLSGSVGLYDLVGKKFYGNVGTGAFVAGPTVSPDGSDKNTLLLLHGEDLFDSSIYNVPIANNGVQISTEQSKFGSSSLYFNGASYLTINTDLMNLDFNLDWTLEWWDYALSGNGTSSAVFRMQNGNYGLITYSLHENKVRIFAGDTGGWGFIPVTTIGDALTNVWVHRAICKKGKKIYAFQNGVLYQTVQTSGSLTKTKTLEIGIRTIGTTGYIGYLDEIRVSNIARWTENFTPPAEPYHVLPATPDSAGDLDPYIWYETDVPAQTQMDQYLANVSALKSTLALARSAPAVPESMQGLTFQKANDIEMLLDLINEYLLALQKIFPRAGFSWMAAGNPGFYFASL